MMHYTTDPDARPGLHPGLRDLADYLDRHPRHPRPAHGATILLHAATADDGGRAQVDHIARQLLDAAVRDETARGGHYWAVRSFGPVGYRIVRHLRRRHGPPPRADVLLAASVTPDTWT